MYAGQIVETGDVCNVFIDPGHPYTKGLIQAMPENGMHPIPGTREAAFMETPGCRFRNRCVNASEKCELDPPFLHMGKNRFVRCHYAGV